VTFISSGISEGVSYKSFLFIVVIAAAVLLYAVGRRIVNKHDFSVEDFKGLHMEVRASFAVVIILVTISHAVGAEIVFGSFIAGIIFSVISGRARDDLKEKVDIIGYGFLVPIFFIEIGVNIDISDVFNNPILLLAIPVLLLIFYAVKAVPSLLLAPAFGIRRAAASSFLLSAQLSLMIVGLQIARNLGIIGEAYYSVSVFAVIISCLLFPALFDKTFSDEGLVRKRRPALDKICIREIVLTNEQSCGKPLREVEFPAGCRIFMIMRDGEELLPNGDTVLQMGDILLVAGIKANEDKMMGIIES
jgi:trk system potassium uptake protein TrkA